jgi:hypothetical protein
MSQVTRTNKEFIMDYHRGDRVRILGKPEWGAGYLQDDCKDGKVDVRFLYAGRKTLNLQNTKLMKVALRDERWIAQRMKSWQNRHFS